MIAYIKGKVTQINLDCLIVECGGIGYQIFFAHPENVSLEQEIQLHTYHKVAEDEQSLYGFDKPYELNFFKQLIAVKGIGAKSAMNILAKVNIDSLITAIGSGNIDFLRSIGGIGAKSAAQIILDLQGKLTFSDNSENALTYSVLQDSLRSLGYKAAEIAGITEALTDIADKSETEILKEALQLLAKQRG